jgi:hypothetical protein
MCVCGCGCVWGGGLRGGGVDKLQRIGAQGDGRGAGGAGGGGGLWRLGGGSRELRGCVCSRYAWRHSAASRAEQHEPVTCQEHSSEAKKEQRGAQQCTYSTSAGEEKLGYAQHQHWKPELCLASTLETRAVVLRDGVTTLHKQHSESSMNQQSKVSTFKSHA